MVLIFYISILVGLFSAGASAVPSIVPQYFNRFGQPLDEIKGNYAMSFDPFTLFHNYPVQTQFSLSPNPEGFYESTHNDEFTSTILILGNSASINLTANKAFHFEDELAKKTKHRVLNLSTPGALVGQELAALIHFGVQHTPKAVVSVSGWHDFNEDFNQVKSFGYGYSEKFNELQKNLRERHLLSSIKKPNAPNGPMPIDRSKFSFFVDSYFNFVQKMNLISKAYGSKFILVLQPDIRVTNNTNARCALSKKQNKLTFPKKYSQFTKLIKNKCDAEGIVCIDLNAKNSFIFGQKDIFLDCINFSQSGLLELAHLITQKVESQ